MWWRPLWQHGSRETCPHRLLKPQSLMLTRQAQVLTYHTSLKPPYKHKSSCVTGAWQYHTTTSDEASRKIISCYQTCSLKSLNSITTLNCAMWYMWGKLECYAFQQLVKQQSAALTWPGYDLTTPHVLLIHKLKDTFTVCLLTVLVWFCP